MPTEVAVDDSVNEIEISNEEDINDQVLEGRPNYKRQTSVQRELADAIVRLAPLDELKLLLDCGAQVNQSVTQGLTPLHYAIWQKYPEAATLLIQEGCDINARDDIGYSALHLAAEHGYTDMIQQLLDSKAQVNFNDPNPEEAYPLEAGDEPLRLALKNGHYDSAKLLLENGANPNSQYFFGSEINLINPLNIELLELLLTYGANANARDRHSFTPLMKACRIQQDAAEELESQELIPGKEVLRHFYVTILGLESVLLLISFGADVNMRTDARHDFRSVLHYAILSGCCPMINLLIKQGATVNFEEGYCKPTPLDLAILKGDIDIVKLLLDAGVDVNAGTPVIGSPLHMACSVGVSGRLKIMRELLERGANPNSVIIGEDGSPIRPALAEYLASNEDPDVEVINLMLKYGAEVVMQSQNRDPLGLLNSLPNLTKDPKILIALLEAAQRFDLSLIRHSSLIDPDSREVFLKIGQSPLPLKHLSRILLRQHLGMRLPQRIDELQMPLLLKKYLLYEIS